MDFPKELSESAYILLGDKDNTILVNAARCAESTNTPVLVAATLFEYARHIKDFIYRAQVSKFVERFARRRYSDLPQSDVLIQTMIFEAGRIYGIRQERAKRKTLTGSQT